MEQCRLMVLRVLRQERIFGAFGNRDKFRLRWSVDLNIASTNEIVARSILVTNTIVADRLVSMHLHCANSTETLGAIKENWRISFMMPDAIFVERYSINALDRNKRGILPHFYSPTHTSYHFSGSFRWDRIAFAWWWNGTWFSFIFGHVQAAAPRSKKKL